MLDWLEKHGEVFLRKNVGIGRNLAKSRAYQKSHETFEGVVQVGEGFKRSTSQLYTVWGLLDCQSSVRPLKKIIVPYLALVSQLS